MSAAAIAIVVLGLALASGLAVAAGLDTTGAIILGLLFGMGLLAVAVARKSGVGSVRPAECAECGGLLSPNAPYCKHCGARVEARS